jgi:membrane protein CcdC involved in cytochrome C biogenesis
MTCVPAIGVAVLTLFPLFQLSGFPVLIKILIGVHLAVEIVFGSRFSVFRVQ